MSRKKRRGRALANIPSGPNTGSGAIYMEGDCPEICLRCTVKRCGWKTTEQFYHDAQVVAHSHAAGHLWPMQQKMPLLPPPPRLMRDIFRLNEEDA